MPIGSVRTVDQLDVACRGSLNTNAVNAVLYQSNPKAGASIHSQLGWKSVLSRNDDLASSDPKMVQQMAHLEKMFSKSTAWAHEQKRSMEFTNDRFEHLVVVIRDEINAEHARETALLTASAHSTKQEQMVVWQQRFASVDRIARTLEGAGTLPPLTSSYWSTHLPSQV